MGNNHIILTSDDGDLELEILEETTVQGKNYILVTDAIDDEDGECYVMRDTSGPDDAEANYEFVDDEEASAVMDVFATLLEGEGITIEK
ncbi:MAG TPA: DUF1292 domain-containing protein [Oribacterium sp.]|jgi:hypothetical protein|nr:DUF1292 domain-containing protein [Oribacterium sp.]